MYLFPFLKIHSSKRPSSFDQLHKRAPLIFLQRGPAYKARNKRSFLCHCNFICKISETSLAPRNDCVPYRSCKGIARQPTAATARPGLHSRQVLTTLPRSACPLPPGEEQEGTSDAQAICLHGVTQHEFRCLLRFFYDRYGSQDYYYFVQPLADSSAVCIGIRISPSRIGSASSLSQPVTFSTISATSLSRRSRNSCSTRSGRSR